MKFKIFSLLFPLVLGLENATPLLAQVTTDGTTSTTVTPTDTGVQIDSGNRSGDNLFHSFDEFSVPTNREAFFNNANDIANIFSRVTGGNISNIDGILRANGAANLFLINPAGILLGENARLQLGGSFYGSTADSIIFPDGEFSATDLDNPPLITINAPIGLGFRDNPNSITVRGNGNGVRTVDSEVIDTNEALRVGEDTTIGILGGELIFEDATIKTAGGRIEIGSVAGGEVDLVEVENGFSFDYSRIDSFQDISLSGTTTIDASGLGSGDIQVAGKNISLQDFSAIEANTMGGESGGSIDILASNSLTISGRENEDNFISGLSSRVFLNATADGGDINVTTTNLTLNNGAILNAATLGQGNAGDITINVNESVSLDSQEIRSRIVSDVASDAVGNGGNITITTTDLALGDRVSISTATAGQGNGGNITINASDRVSLNNSSDIDAKASNLTDLEGNAGNIEINTGSLSIDNESELLANTLFTQTAKGGKIAINATDDVSLNNGSEINVTGSEGGSIDLTAKNLTVMSDSILVGGIAEESGFVEAQSKDITINLIEDLVLGSSDGESVTLIGNSSLGTGDAGNIEINARNITFRNGANIFSPNVGEGNLGTINLNATGDITFDGIKGAQSSGVNNLVAPEATGDVGEINIIAQNLTLTNGARIISVIGGMANGGDINLNVADTITIDGFGLDETGDTPEEVPSSIFSNVAFDGIGNSGNINIETQNLSVSETGIIDTKILGQGNAGSINLNATNNVALNNGEISTSNEGQGDVGDITINATNSFTATKNSLITSNIGTAEGIATTGKAGNIFIRSRDISFAEASKIEAGAFTNATVTQLGNISLTATERISLNGFQIGIDARNSPGSLGDTSNILLSTENLTLNNGMIVTNANFGEGNAGSISIDTNNLTVTSGAQIANVIVRGNADNITINATDTVFLDGEGSGLGSQVLSGAVGNAGEVRINTKNLSLANGAQVGAGTFGRGNAGNVIINATNTVSLDGEDSNGVSTIISSSVQPGAIGEGGEVRIDTKNLSLTNGGQIQNNTSNGNAGSVTINATDTVFLDGEGRDGNPSSISSSVENDGLGNAGEVKIDTNNLSILNGAQIQSGTSGEGNGSTITVNATNTISLDGVSSNGFGSAIVTSVQPDAIGNAGEVEINSKNLFLTNGAFISSSTLSEGDAGSLTVRVSDAIKLSGVSPNGRGGLFVIALESIGNGGDLAVFTDELTISDGASISASNFPSIGGLRNPGTGEAGSVRIEADNITLENEARINTATQAGDKGNITLDVAEDIILRGNSFISARALKDATGGNVEINTEFILAFPSQLDGNDIRADANQGQGGNINITAESVFGIAESETLNPLTNDINASSDVAGLEGTISINTPDINPLRATSELPSNLISTNTLETTSACQVSSIEETSNLIVKGKGGILPKIIEPFTSDSLIIDESTVTLNPINTLQALDNHLMVANTPNYSSTDAIKPVIETEKTGKLYAARGIVKQEDGTVYLTAYPTSNTTRTIANNPLDCIH